MIGKTILAIGIAGAVAAGVVFTRRTEANPPGLSGTIVAVDSRQHRVQVADSATIEYWIRINEATTITLNGFAASFNQLAAGQKVDVQYEPDTFIATQIDARTQ